MDTQARVDRIVDTALHGDWIKLRTLAYMELETVRTEERERVLQILAEESSCSPEERQLIDLVRAKARPRSMTPVDPSKASTPAASHQGLCRCVSCGLVYDYQTLAGVRPADPPLFVGTTLRFMAGRCVGKDCSSQEYSLIGVGEIWELAGRGNRER